MSTGHNIWDVSGDGIPEDKLSAYLEGTLSEKERLEVEAWLSEEGAESDAIEGLQLISGDEAQAAKRHINARLQQTIGRKRKKRSYLNNQKEVWVIVVIVLLLIIICFGVMWYLKHPAKG